LNYTFAAGAELGGGVVVNHLQAVKEGEVVEEGDQDKEPPVLVAKKLAKRLKPHQIDGIRFIWQNLIVDISKLRDPDHGGLGCVLAHSMGLGKTIQVGTRQLFNTTPQYHPSIPYLNTIPQYHLYSAIFQRAARL
jgi:SNF2 family DNA or RNA helicase